jgi:hypothetical protein
MFYTILGSTSSMVRNILAIYDAANKAMGEPPYAHLLPAAGWYDKASMLVDIMVERSEFDHVQVAGVIALTSKNATWQQNIDKAEKVIYNDDYTSVVTEGDRLKIYDILHGDLSVLQVGAVVKGKAGHKIYSFWHNIISGGMDEHVTIDRWAARIALGGMLTTNQSNRIMRNEKYNERVQNAYRIAAGIVNKRQGFGSHSLTYGHGITGAQLQAITWAHIVEQKNSVGDNVPD